jgi:flagellar basal body-associated protein FliL
MIANELREKDETIRQELEHVFEALRERIAMFLKKEKSEERLLPAAREEQLAELCVATMQGAMLMGKVRGDCQTLKNLFEDLSTHLHRFRID